MAQIVLSPTAAWLEQAVSGCVRSFVAASPFVGPTFEKIVAPLLGRAQVVLVTRMDLRAFAAGFSDIDCVWHLARLQTSVYSVPHLHAKVYVADAANALVTSANATDGGLCHNVECGIAVSDTTLASQLHRLVLSGFGAPEGATKWQEDELGELSKIVQSLREVMPRIPIAELQRLEVKELELPDADDLARLLASLKGWTALTLEAVLRQPDNEFALDQLFATAIPAARSRYPRNRHVRAKLRQQLQKLRDLGLVQFLGGGRYRRLLSVRRRHP